MNPTALDQPALNTSGIHPALRSFADECNAVAVRILAYVSGLAVLAVLVVDLLSAAPVAATTGTPALPGWVPASRPHPAFAISKLNLSERTDAYEILRHPEGGRRDILRWAAAAGDPPTAEIEIYRPGGELDAFAAADVAVATRMAGQQANGTGGNLAGDAAGNIEPAGVVDTKFGQITLLRLRGMALAGKQACLGFVKTFTTPKSQDQRMGLSGRHAGRPEGLSWLHTEPVDPAVSRQRSPDGRTVRARRTQASRLQHDDHSFNQLDRHSRRAHASRPADA